VSHKNLKALYFRAFPLDLEAHPDTPGPYSPNPGRTAIEKLLRTQPIASWTVELPETPDFRAHTTWVVPPIDHPGAYRILASAREDIAPEDNQIADLRLLLGDLVLTVRAGTGGRTIDVLALSGATGDPVSGAEVRRDRQQKPDRDRR
jgi:hypothetical protein